MVYDDFYQKNKKVFGNNPEEILVKYNTEIITDAPILDIGAGQGRNTIYLSKLGFNVIAIDPSSISAKILENERSTNNLTYEVYNTNFREYESNKKYSAILVFGLLQILDWQEIELLKNKIKNCLIKDGLLFITSFTDKDSSHIRIKEEAQIIGKNSYLMPNGEKRLFFESEELKKKFNEFEILHYWEGSGPEHRHGNGSRHKHELVEAVFKR